MAKTKMVRVSEEEWQLLKRARDQLQRNGYGRLEERLEDVGDQLKDEGEPVDLGELVAGFALGAVAAVGAVAIIKMLSDTSKTQG